MTKSIKAFGMAVFAAMVVLALDLFSRQPESAAPRYEQFSGCPVSTESRCSTTGACWTSTVEACKSIQSGVADLKVDITDRWGEPFAFGNHCYVGGSKRLSLIARELLAMPNVKNPIKSKVSSEVSLDSAHSTNTFYEQTQLKDCLA